MESTSEVVSGALSTQGPPGITWWVWTSKMNSVPVSACWHAAVSSGGGALNVPPGPWWGAARSFEAGADEQPASSNTAREAATAPAPCKKRRRSTPVRLADSSMARRTNSLTALSRAPLSAGTNSPLEIGPAGSGSWSSYSSRSRRENRPLTAMAWNDTTAPAATLVTIPGDLPWSTNERRPRARRRAPSVRRIHPRPRSRTRVVGHPVRRQTRLSALPGTPACDDLCRRGATLHSDEGSGPR